MRAVDNCLFCKIAAKTIPSTIVYEDEHLLAFKDINPAAPVHLLVIPKQHFGTLSDCSANEAPLLGKMLALAPRLAEEFGCAVSYDADGAPASHILLLLGSTEYLGARALQGENNGFNEYLALADPAGRRHAGVRHQENRQYGFRHRQGRQGLQGWRARRR